MNLHEYQAKALFSEYGIPVPDGEPATTAEQAVAVAGSLGGEVWVVKAQAHTGGRGKAGGVKLARSLDEVRAAAEEMIGMTLVTKQTGADGLPVAAAAQSIGFGGPSDRALLPLLAEDSARRPARSLALAARFAVRRCFPDIC